MVEQGQTVLHVLLFHIMTTFTKNSHSKFFLAPKRKTTYLSIYEKHNKYPTVVQHTYISSLQIPYNRHSIEARLMDQNQVQRSSELELEISRYLWLQEYQIGLRAAIKLRVRVPVGIGFCLTLDTSNDAFAHNHKAQFIITRIGHLTNNTNIRRKAHNFIISLSETPVFFIIVIVIIVVSLVIVSQIRVIPI